MTDITRDLIQRLAEKLDLLHCQYHVPNQSALIDEAYAYLSQPEPEEAAPHHQTGEQLMSKPQVTTQIRIQTERDYWFTVEDIYLDLGVDGLTISYWDLRDGKEERVKHICIDESLALTLADFIYKLFKKENN